MGPWSENVTEGGKEDESDLFLSIGELYQQCTLQKKDLREAGLWILEKLLGYLVASAGAGAAAAAAAAFLALRAFFFCTFFAPVAGAEAAAVAAGADEAAGVSVWANAPAANKPATNRARILFIQK